jgi:hypothetical protein
MVNTNKIFFPPPSMLKSPLNPQKKFVLQVFQFPSPAFSSNNLKIKNYDLFEVLNNFIKSKSMKSHVMIETKEDNYFTAQSILMHNKPL